jgi:hypothetical protein
MIDILRLFYMKFIQVVALLGGGEWNVGEVKAKQ